MPLIPIDSLADPRIAEYANLRDAELRHRTDPSLPVTGAPGLFMAEGELVVRRLIAAAPRFRTRSVLTTPTRLATIRDATDRLPADTPVYLVDQSVMNGIVGFNMHRGILALGAPAHSADGAAAFEIARAARLLVILEDLVNHDNIGAIFRNTAALAGPGAAILLSPRCADPLYRKSLRVSVGHVLSVPFARLDRWPGDLAHLRTPEAGGWRIFGLSPSPDAVPIDEFATRLREPRPNLALVLGTEGPGLSDAVTNILDERVRIPIAPGVDSLNVAIAGAIALHRLGSISAGTSKTPPAST